MIYYFFLHINYFLYLPATNNLFLYEQGTYMRTEYYSEIDRQLLFSIYDSSKKQKNNQIRNHKHADLELGFIINGTGIYVLNQISYQVNPGDLFIVRPNEQHCIPTITTEKLISFNIHINAYYLWNICTDYIEPDKIQALIHSEVPIKQHFSSNDKINNLINRIWKLFHENTEYNRFQIRDYVLEFIKMIAKGIVVTQSNTNFSEIRFHDIQKSINYIRPTPQHSTQR